MKANVSRLNQMLEKVKPVLSGARSVTKRIWRAITFDAQRRKLKTTVAFFLFRRSRLFVVAAILRYVSGLIFAFAFFSWAWVQFIGDPSAIMRYGKILTAFFPLSYVVARIFSRVADYRGRHKRRMLPLKLKLLNDKDVDNVPAFGWQAVAIPGSWLIVALAIHLVGT